DHLALVVDDLRARFGSPDLAIEAMAPLSRGVELIVGARWDPSFGPVVLVGLGGVYTEVLRDTVVALAPVDQEAAADMLRSLGGAALFLGARGRPAGALDAAAPFVATFSALAARHPQGVPMEVNPLPPPPPRPPPP